jgi:hypothetical protein
MIKQLRRAFFLSRRAPPKGGRSGDLARRGPSL